MIKHKLVQQGDSMKKYSVKYYAEQQESAEVIKAVYIPKSALLKAFGKLPANVEIIVEEG